MGGLVSDFRFIHVQVVFDYLLPWTQPAGIAARGVTDHEEVVIDTRRATVDHAILADKSTVRLCTGVEGRWDHASAHLDQWSALEISGHAQPAHRSAHANRPPARLRPVGRARLRQRRTGCPEHCRRPASTTCARRIVGSYAARLGNTDSRTGPAPLCASG
jgi:hypothetical protein